jgi:transposase-like protein
METINQKTNEIPKVVAKLSRDKKTFKINCPYCHKTHTHGAGNDQKAYGHRLAHCDNTDANNVGYDLVSE